MSGFALAAEVTFIDDLSGVYGPAEGACVAAESPLRLTIAWTVGEGEPAEGLYLLRRTNLWDSAPTRIDQVGGDSPRDAHLVVDDRGRTHVVWTALSAGRRRVFHAALSDSGFAIEPRVVNPDDDADADYPQIVFSPGRALYVVWQANRVTQFTIEAAHLALNGTEFTRLPAASGSSRWAIRPQVVEAGPLKIGFDEVLEADSELRLAALDLFTRSWSRRALPALGPEIAFRPGVLLAAGGGDSVTACWIAEGEDGATGITLARPGTAGAEAPETIELGRQAADHSRPHLAHVDEDRSTVCWQVFAGGFQSIRLARVTWEGGASAETVTVSPPSHRFASDPRHESRGSWSVIVWTDDDGDGGSGKLGLAEVDWGSGGV